MVNSTIAVRTTLGVKSITLNHIIQLHLIVGRTFQGLELAYKIRHQGLTKFRCPSDPVLKTSEWLSSKEVATKTCKQRTHTQTHKEHQLLLLYQK